MFPKLLDLGPVSLYSYGVLLAAAYLLGLQLALRRAAAAGLNPGKVMDLGIWVVLSALVGAKLLLVLIDLPHFLANPSEIFSMVRSAGVFYGGLIAAVGVGLWYMRRNGLPVWTTADLFAPGIALGHVIGRLGCFMAGCCFGRPSDLPWAVTFTSPLAAEIVGTPLHVPLHPTQLYESFAELLILVFLLVFEKRGRAFPGRTFWGYLVLYSITRFVIEGFRGDERGLVFGLWSTSQFISLVLLPVSIAMLVYLSRRPAAAAKGHPPLRPAR
ncbi:MAG: prolipoprotein diacylglyceryl transferase [Vicinamibacterales bacterium]|nr:prolipoprotein diacylglyceryl transferase [Vicinamibacterales bacterium]